VPTRNDLDLLIASVGGETFGGRELKEAGNAHWANNASSTNSSRFTALPAGIRTEHGLFTGASGVARFWSVAVTPGSPIITSLHLNNGEDIVRIYGSAQEFGYSVRCIRD
jgi:uncharacterized protein (TIGR02145 family)